MSASESIAPGRPTTLFDVVQRFVGTREVPGVGSDPLILAALQTDAQWPTGDEVPWCSAWLNLWAKSLGLPRSKSLRARSWLGVGRPVRLEDALVGFDVVITKRGGADAPGPENLTAPGHVGLYAGDSAGKVFLLGGNQGDTVTVAPFSTTRVLGVRRLWG